MAKPVIRSPLASRCLRAAVWLGVSLAAWGPYLFIGLNGGVPRQEAWEALGLHWLIPAMGAPALLVAAYHAAIALWLAWDAAPALGEAIRRRLPPPLAVAVARLARPEGVVRDRAPDPVGRLVAAAAWSLVAIAGLWPLWPGVGDIPGRAVGFLDLLAYSGGALGYVALAGLAGALVAFHHLLTAADATIDRWALRRSVGLEHFRVVRLAVPAGVALVVLVLASWTGYHHLRRDAHGNFLALVEHYEALGQQAWARLPAVYERECPPAEIAVPRAGEDPVPALRELRTFKMVEVPFHISRQGELTMLLGGDVVRARLSTWRAGFGVWPAFGPPYPKHDRRRAIDLRIAALAEALGYFRWGPGNEVAFTPAEGLDEARMLVLKSHREGGWLGFFSDHDFVNLAANEVLRDLGIPGSWSTGPIGHWRGDVYMVPPAERPPEALRIFRLILDDDLSAAATTGHVERTITFLGALFVLFGAALLETARQFRALIAERAMRMAQSGFVSGVSHEMRTPLATIRLYTELLEQGLDDAPGRRAEFLRAILTEVDRLHRLIENVLDFARISGRKRTYALAPADLRMLVDEAVAAARGPLAAAEMTCEVHMPAPITATVDRDAVVQALANLITNAAKYAADGKRVWVSVMPGPLGVAFAVQDFGPGLAADERKKVFDPFYRVAGSAAGGSGLGLALVREYARAHGGRVEVESHPGRGATFSIHLPLEPAATSAKPVAA